MPKRLMYSALLCLLLVAALPPATQAQVAADGRPDQIILTPPERNQSLRSVTGTDYLSPPTEAPRGFTHMLLRWQANVPEGAAMQLEVRASADGNTWTPWNAVEENGDLWMPDDGPNTTWSQTIDAGFVARFWQVRGSFTPAPSGALPALQRVDVNTVNTNTFAPKQNINATPRVQPNGAIAKPRVVSRTEWGSPDGQGSRVKPSYYPVNHAVVHHTADSNTLLDNEPNWAARVRAEWSFHTYTRGWGDVGYNYLIDPNGVIYEGRAGGDDAVAFHDTANYGSMGVVIIGTYNSVQPTSPSQDSLVRLLSWKAAQKRIDPLGRSYYYGCAISTYCYPYNFGAIVLNIAGHRNVMPGQTTCPGDKTIDILPNVRNRVKQALDGTPADNGDLEIDELESSFARSNANWYDATCGAGGHTYYTFGTDNPAESTNGATWRPNIPASDTSEPQSYRVFAHIPQGCGIGTAPYATQKAVYNIHSADGDFQRTVDQNTADEWVDLGLYRFNAGTDGAVELNDLTGDSFNAQRVVFFDSVKWVPESDSTNVALVNVAYDKNTVAAGDLLRISFTLKNIGDTTLYSQEPQIDLAANGGLDGPDNGYVYDQDECFLGDTNGSYPAYPKESGRFRVALGLASVNPASASNINCAGSFGGYPWRWGLNQPLAPGAEQTVIGYVRFRTPGQYTLQAGVVQEYFKYYVEGASTATVTVTPEQFSPDVSAFDAQLRPVANVYRMGNVPDNLLARTRNPLSIPRGDYVGSFAWDGSFTDWGNNGPLDIADSFVIEQTRSFIAPVSGDYTFLTSSDDGSWLWVDGKPVVDNYGLHAANAITGTVKLDAGMHTLSFKYFNRGGSAAAGYAVRLPGISGTTPSGADASSIPPTATNGFEAINDELAAGTPRIGNIFAMPPAIGLVADDQGGAGVNRMRVRINDGEWQETLTSQVQLGPDLFPNGSYRIQYSAVDNAGNISPMREIAFKVDTTMEIAHTFMPFVSIPTK